MHLHSPTGERPVAALNGGIQPISVKSILRRHYRRGVRVTYSYSNVPLRRRSCWGPLDRVAAQVGTGRTREIQDPRAQPS
jgi:hypothetical protein